MSISGESRSGATKSSFTVYFYTSRTWKIRFYFAWSLFIPLTISPNLHPYTPHHSSLFRRACLANFFPILKLILFADDSHSKWRFKLGDLSTPIKWEQTFCERDVPHNGTQWRGVEQEVEFRWFTRAVTCWNIWEFLKRVVRSCERWIYAVGLRG